MEMVVIDGKQWVVLPTFSQQKPNLSLCGWQQQRWPNIVFTLGTVKYNRNRTDEQQIDKKKIPETDSLMWWMDFSNVWKRGVAGDAACRQHAIKKRERRVPATDEERNRQFSTMAKSGQD
ncbi:hypothetical protein AVEN_23407-1 [Araneus ventricosus]|uniref:Uncharacterized protein n=1 Tax=Araneus ventricosus TaxID=182803 RepID=A0A4Y2E6R8_ARAVE|nr:hypothetical protein AVEN_23407-1 [Araneus ventricosus]